MTTDISITLDKTLQHLKEEYAGISIGRANPGIVEHIEVEAYGSAQTIKNLANISVPDSQTLRIEPWDKSLVAKIEKGIRESNMGLNPQNMGDSLFVPIPPLTEERRIQLVKKIKEIGEESRITVRNIRHEALKGIKKQQDNKELSEDEAKREEKTLQEKIDEANKKIEEIIKTKEKDILSI